MNNNRNQSGTARSISRNSIRNTGRTARGSNPSASRQGVRPRSATSRPHVSRSRAKRRGGCMTTVFVLAVSMFVLVITAVAWRDNLATPQYGLAYSGFAGLQQPQNEPAYHGYLLEEPQQDITYESTPMAPPRIYGADDIYVRLGGPAMFRRGVSAYDASNRPINFTVDSSEVDLDTLGTYTATFEAVDDRGQAVTKTIYVHVLEIDPELVRALADTVLDGIINDGMTQVEKARAIFNWVGGHVGYAATAGNRTLYEGAYQALRNRFGDCYVFYAISELLLTRAGIPNMKIARVGGITSHYWNIINPDGLGWHHFDATPLRAQFNNRIDRFMFTSSQAREFTEMIVSELFTPNYYAYNPDLYPEIVW